MGDEGSEHDGDDEEEEEEEEEADYEDEDEESEEDTGHYKVCFYFLFFKISGRPLVLTSIHRLL
jgi:hypothetical protein